MASTPPERGEQLPIPEISESPTWISDQDTSEAQPYAQANGTPTLWTQADYLNAGHINRDLLGELIESMLDDKATKPDDTEFAKGMHARAKSQLGEAFRRTGAPSINLHSLAYGIFANYTAIDDNRTLPRSGGPNRTPVADPGVDAQKSREAKTRFLDFMDAEARILGNKEMENFLLYVEDLVSCMRDVFDSIQKEACQGRSEEW